MPLIATNEVYYLEKSMSEAHDALMCIGQKTYVNDTNRFKLSNQHYFKSSEEMEIIFEDIPEIIHNNFNVANNTQA